MKTKVSSWALVLLSSMLITLTAVFFGIAIANASDTSDDVTSAPRENPVLDGIYIYRSGGTILAEENVDFSIDTTNRVITILKNDLVLSGGSDKGPINARIVVPTTTTEPVSKLTLEELHIYDKTADHSTLEINCPSANNENSNDPDFTLNINYACTLYQTLDDTHGQNAIRILGGNNNGFVINGDRSEDEDITLECVATFLDAIYVESEPVTFTGGLNALVYSEKDDGIDWGSEGDNESLTISGHARIAFGSENIHVYSAIDVGSLNVINQASLVALGNNKDSKEVPAVKVRNKFTVNTTGDVLIDAWNDKSWEALDCNDLDIQKCKSFTAIAQDYTALICRGNMKIGDDAIENVYLSGGFIPRLETDHRARRGAFVIEHPNRLTVPDGYLLYGSEEKTPKPEANEIDLNRRSVITFSSGSDEFDVYTPVILNGKSLPKYANTVVFKKAQEVVFVPGQKATYSEAGFNPSYKYKDSEDYFEDYDQQMPIDDYATWKSPGGDGYIPSFRGSFDEYRNSVLDKCDELYVFGDAPEINNLIQDAKSEIESYTYDEERTISQNKSNLDSIYERLKWDIDMLPMPVPEPANWVPANGTEVVDASNSGQTGDNLALLIVAIIALLALSSALVVLKKKNILKFSIAGQNNVANVISNHKIMVFSVAFLVSALLFAGLAVANASENNEAAAPVTSQDNSLLSKFFTPNFKVAYPGLSITKINSEGTEVDAEPNVDFVANTEFKTLQISTDGLIITGIDPKNYVEVSIITTIAKENVKNLTLNNAKIYSQYSSSETYGNTLVLNCDQYQPEPEPEQYIEAAPSNNFNLNIKGTCYIGQENYTEGGRPIYVSGGGGSYGANIHGDTDSTLYVYSTWYEGIMSQQAPLQFSGDLDITILSVYDNCIAWEAEHYTDVMFISDDVYMTCFSPQSDKYEAIKGGSIFVVNNASLIALNNNSGRRDEATISLRHTFGISTTGVVKIGNINSKSWQAIKCENLFINECGEFVAVSQDYAAIECSGILSVQSPNVWIYGEYNREETGNAARKGAFTIKDLKQLNIGANLTMLGNQQAPADITDEDWGPIVNPTAMVQTSGDDVYELYSPVACDGNFATIAKIITFVNTSHNTQLVPGEAPSFALPGYKDCYKCIDCGCYFTDEQCETKINNVDLWRLPLGGGFLAPYCFEFKIYQAEIRCQCEENMIKRADVPEIRAMIAAAQARIDSYVYDEGMSLAANKAAIDLIYYQLYDEVVNYVPAEYVDPAKTGDNWALYTYAIIAIAAIAGTSAFAFSRKKAQRN